MGESSARRRFNVSWSCSDVGGERLRTQYLVTEKTQEFAWRNFGFAYWRTVCSVCDLLHESKISANSLDLCNDIITICRESIA
jgi:hypothetical protein